MSILQGARDTTINNSVLNNILGDATIVKIDGTGQFSDEFKDLFVKHIAGAIVAPNLRDRVEKHALNESIRSLPRAEAAYNDYALSDRRRVICLEGTREALLAEIAQWVTVSDQPQIYLLFGPAGFGKSTIAQTIAARADKLLLLGASFFFSRDEPKRRNAKRFFTTIAFQLCVYDPEFAQAIGTALQSDRGSAASKGPLEQLTDLIIKPLNHVIKSRAVPILIVVDALDECDDADALIVTDALNYLVRQLPCFKVVLTTRPQLHLAPFYDGPRKGTHKAFHLQNIEDKVVDGDIQLFLKHGLSHEQVAIRLPNLRKPWCATDQDIEVLVHAFGRLFIIASTAVRFILDTTEYNPASQLSTLVTHSQLALDILRTFYVVILRRAVPKKCRSIIVDRFQAVVGAILVIPVPLSIKVLAHLTHPWSADDIDAVLKNLQSVIMVDEETPRIYHKSLSDFLTDPELCYYDELHIVPKDQHTRITIRCLQIMNQRLKRNILNLDGLAQFKSNDEAIKERIISEDQMQERIPPELRYACTYWAHHLERGDNESANLRTELEIFAVEHLLHWLEALSWLGALEIAHRILGALMKLMPPSLCQLFSDGQRFISRFYARIQESALHVYYSALPFTPTQCLLRETYREEPGLCKVHGGPTQWDATIANIDDVQDERASTPVIFSQDGSQFASCSKRGARLWDSVSGTPLSTFEYEAGALSGDFSTVALCWDATVTLRNVTSNAPIATLDCPSKICELALSFDGAHLAVRSSDGMVILWITGTSKPVAYLGRYGDSDSDCHLEFSPSGHRLALSHAKDPTQLWDGEDGHFVATLGSQSDKHSIAFSRDGCRIASLAGYTLSVWKSDNGDLIGSSSRNEDGPSSRNRFAISPDGSLFATATRATLQFWKADGNPLSLIAKLGVPVKRIECLALSSDMVAVGSYSSVRLYNLENHMLVAVLKGSTPISLAFSPDCSRLAAATWNSGGTLRLWDVPTIKKSGPENHERRVISLAISPDCSRLASGLNDGTIDLWDIFHTGEIIASHRHHSGGVDNVVFCPVGERLVSGSWDGTIMLWDGIGGTPIGVLERSFERLSSISISSNMLAIATDEDMTLWDSKLLHLVVALETGSHNLSLSNDGTLLASIPCEWESRSSVVIWDVQGRVKIGVVEFTGEVIRSFFSPDGSRLAVQLATGEFSLSKICDKKMITLGDSEDLTWLPVPRWNGYLISLGHRDDNYNCCVLARSPDQGDSAPLIWIPTHVDISSSAFGASLFALRCDDGGVIFIQSSSTSYRFPLSM